MFNGLQWVSLILISPAQLLSSALLCWVSVVAYRLLGHPLRAFPGDKLAAVSGWYWAYHASDSQYLSRLHKIYGPVVRIAPNRLHFSDCRAYHDIYAPGSKFTKEPAYYANFAADESSFGLIDPKTAKAQKDIISPLFSRRAILKLESVIQDKIDILISQILTHTDRPVDLHYAFRSTSLDIISSYCFAESWSTLTYPSFQHPMLHGMDEALRLFWFLLSFPFLHIILKWRPVQKVAGALNPNMRAALAVRSHRIAQIDKIVQDPGVLYKVEHETVYHRLMQPDNADFQTPSKKMLFEESTALMFAGSDTVANTLTVGAFHILANPSVLAAVVHELQEAWPDKDTKCGYQTLEKLPYLTAVIKESLRLSMGVASPMPRIVGPSSAVIAGIDVPVGTSVSICTAFMHTNPDLFPDPMAFVPERWLHPESQKLENYLVPFSKGPRSCVGINLAWCELYLVFGNMLRKLDMQLYNTTADDMTYAQFFMPVFTGKHLQARVQEKAS